MLKKLEKIPSKRYQSENYENHQSADLGNNLKHSKSENSRIVSSADHHQFKNPNDLPFKDSLKLIKNKDHPYLLNNGAAKGKQEISKNYHVPVKSPLVLLNDKNDSSSPSISDEEEHDPVKAKLKQKEK